MICSKCGTMNTNESQQCRRCSTNLHPEGMKGKIACIVHANREATTSCASCANRLCGACAVNASGVDYCESCAPANAIRHEYDEDYERIPVVNAAKTEKAGFGLRLIGILLDVGVFFVAVGLIALVSFSLSGNVGFVLAPTSGTGFYVFWAVVALAGIVYSAVLTSMTGQTLGKQVAGVIVLEPDGHILPLRACLIRSAMALLSALPLGLGFWWALWDKEGRTWHDKLAGTSVFRWEEVA